MFGETGNYTITHGDDVVVGMQTYKKFIDPFFSNMKFLLREDVDAKKVRKIVDGNEVLFLDFSLNLGDHFLVGGLADYVVSAVNDINVNGGQRRQLTLSNPSSS